LIKVYLPDLFIYAAVYTTLFNSILLRSVNHNLVPGLHNQYLAMISLPNIFQHELKVKSQSCYTFGPP